MDNTKLALNINKLIHNECKDVPHDIGLCIVDSFIEKAIIEVKIKEVEKIIRLEQYCMNTKMWRNSIKRELEQLKAKQ